MNREDIIKMAREAGLCWQDGEPMIAAERFERFAALVAAAEREACANILAGKITGHAQYAQEYALRGEYDGVDAILSTIWKLSECTDAIRERGKK